jgi:hypothetical protein
VVDLSDTRPSTNTRPIRSIVRHVSLGDEGGLKVGAEFVQLDEDRRRLLRLLIAVQSTSSSTG